MESPSDQYQHPLPQPPQHQQQPEHHQQHPAQLHYQQQQQQQQSQTQPPTQYPPHPAQHRQTKSRSFSFKSDKSHKSAGSKDFHETHNEKESRRLHSKADPTLAMSEAEPSAIAAMASGSSVAPLRSIQHKDTFGNAIADPDRSNPTRNRWERPLDTIRSFEAAIDGGYNRKSMYRADTDTEANWNRRSSFHPGSQPRFPQDSYYGSRPVSIRQDNRNSFYEAQGGYNGANNGGYNGGYNGNYNQPPARRMSRMNTEPQYPMHSQPQNVYPLPHKDRSYETVTSAAASGNSDQAGYHTDPTSSDNSSIERNSPAKRREQVNDYGIGFSQPQAYQNPSFSVGLPANGANGNHPLPPPPVGVGQHQQHGPPPVPRKQPSVLRRQPTQTRPEMPEKRKSWFARRFSKNS